MLSTFQPYGGGISLLVGSKTITSTVVSKSSLVTLSQVNVYVVSDDGETTSLPDGNTTEPMPGDIEQE